MPLYPQIETEANYINCTNRVIDHVLTAFIEVYTPCVAL